jgi:AmmeMemoRadiSam system protein A
MAPISSNDFKVVLPEPSRRQLLEVASAAIRSGLVGTRRAVRGADFPEGLRSPRASFVTLYLDQRLRGCIGSLEAQRALVEDVAHNAYGAAFEDPRFSPLTEEEFAFLKIHVSILSSPEPMRFCSETELQSQLRPHVDGLVLEEGWRRGTFLPSVWEQHPDPHEFLRHLKHKAGLPEDYWSPTMVVRRYTVEELS